jgi:TBC1 domain family protein 5
LDYFRDPQVQYDLTNILYIQAVANPDIGYRQGMHELLASIYLAMDSDSLDRWTSSVHEQDILDMCDRTWVAADAWTLFEVLMQAMNVW